jgi:hypothetical protein
LEAKVVFYSSCVELQLIVVGKDLSVRLCTQASKFCSLCGFTFSLGSGHETFVVGDAFTFSLHVDVVKGLGHKGTDGAFTFIVSEEGDDGVANVGHHVFNPAGEVGVGGVVVDVEDLTDEVGAEFSQLLVFPLIGRSDKVAMGIVEDSRGGSTNIAATGDESSVQISVRDIDVRLGEAMEAELPAGGFSLG